MVRKYVKWLFINLVLLSLFTVLLRIIFFGGESVVIVGVKPLAGYEHFRAILLNNSQNYLLTIILFPLLPLIYSYNWLSICFSIAMHWYNSGDLIYTLKILLPHGMIEIPVILMYQFLSFELLKAFIGSSELKTISDFLKQHRNYFIITYLGLVIAAFLEGYIVCW